MYQIVSTSEFIRKLQESTRAVPSRQSAIQPASEPAPAPRRVPGARAPRILESLAALASGLGLRVLGSR